MEEKYMIPNLRNACRALKLLADKNRPLTLKEISTSLSVPRTTALRIVTTLTAESLTKKTDDGYALGASLIGLGAVARSQIDLVELAEPLLQEVTRRTGETCHLAIPADNRSLIVAVSISPHPLSSSRAPGAMVELHCSATGKCFLAHLHGDRLPETLARLAPKPYTPNTIVSVAEMEQETQRIRARGYAIDEQEMYEGVRCIAAPVFDSDRSCVAALGVTASATRFTLARVEAFAQIVLEASESLRRKLGGQAAAARA